MILASMKLITALSIFAVLMIISRTEAQNRANIPEPETPKIWSERWPQKLALVKKGNIDLIFVGDSISEGWDYPENHDVWSAYYGSRNGASLGFSGARTENILWMLENGLVEGLSPKVAVVLIGTNNTDWLHFSHADSAEDIAEGIKKIVSTLRSKLPKTKIILLKIFPRNNIPRTGETAEKAADLSQDIADGKWVTWLDINKIYLRPDGTIDPAIMPDLLHPNPVGDLYWAEAMEPLLEKLMGKPANTAIDPQPGIEKDFYDWMPRHEAVKSAVKQQRPELVFIGDSIVHMFGGNPQSNITHGESVWNQYYGKRNAVNLGFGWDRTQQVLWRLENGELDGYQPKAAVLLIGTNNLTPNAVRGNTNQEIVDGIKKICETIRKKSPGTSIILTGLLPRGENPGDLYRIRVSQINRQLAKMNGHNGISFVDIGPKLLDASGHFLPGTSYDHIHLDEKGFAVWAAAIEPLIGKALNDDRVSGR